MRTIAQVLSKAKVGDSLTDGKRIWYVTKGYSLVGSIAIPVLKNGDLDPKGFELWRGTELEKVAVIPNLRVVKYNRRRK